MSDKRDLLFEIGCEELPASFVETALEALPRLAEAKLGELRLGFEGVRALGTPRRLALLVTGLDTMQPDLAEEVTGPPVKAAFKDGAPTKAALAFAEKLGLTVEQLERIDTPKGEYLKGMRREVGRPALSLLPEALAEIATKIPFRKSMRWGAGEITFGRPLRWLLALLGRERIPVKLGDLEAGTVSYGHRFLHPGEVAIDSPDGYVDALRRAHVIVDPKERARLMRERLLEAAERAGGELIEDEFLIAENLSLVEDPQVVLGRFDAEFLELPDVVILEVARGHQRYFGLRKPNGELMPSYLAVVNTNKNPERIAEGNDRVMRARLADARFFYTEDMKRALATRRDDLGGIVFQNRLGSVLDKVRRLERLVAELGTLAGAEASVVEAAVEAAHLCKCDLVTWMVGEFPELQGEMGRAYALSQGIRPEVADAIRDHYKPKGARDATPEQPAAALVALADRLDTLVGCFAIGLSPSGTADPYGLRRAAIGTLRILLDRELPIALSAAIVAAYRSYEGVELDLDAGALGAKLGAFFRDRLRGILTDELPADAVDAALGVAADTPVDARARARAILRLDDDVRAKVGEVFKRATNIAKDAPEGEPERGAEPAEVALYEAFFGMRADLEAHIESADYGSAFARLAELAPVLGRYFDEVLVMAENAELRANRLRLMRAISDTCSRLARLELLGGG